MELERPVVMRARAPGRDARHRNIARAGAALLAAATLAAGTPASAQDFPVHPIRLIVPWPPGGNVDITARTLAPALGEALGQTIVIDNRAGAGGTIGTTVAIKAPPDGYTLLMGSSGTVTVAPTVYRNIAYDPVRDLTAIGLVHVVPMVLTAAARTPVASFADLVALSRQRGGNVSIASAGNGSSNHLAIELLLRLSGIRLLHVPYKGAGPALNDLLGGQVDTMMDQLSASSGPIRDGRIKALAVTTATRSALLPEVPTLAEAGVAGYEASTFTGLFAPAGLPRATLDRLVEAVRRALAEEPVRARYRAMGVELRDMSREDFQRYVREDYAKWRRVARDGNIAID